MKVYYAQAYAGGVSVAEKIDGYEGGRLIWVKDYNCGFFSSTNVVFPDGSTNRVNAALAMSCNIDSDGDGQVNCVDPSPIPPGQLSSCSCNPTIITLPVNLSTGGGGGSGRVPAHRVARVQNLISRLCLETAPTQSHWRVPRSADCCMNRSWRLPALVISAQ